MFYWGITNYVELKIYFLCSQNSHDINDINFINFINLKAALTIYLSFIVGIIKCD